jgi:hypothetical protein
MLRKPSYRKRAFLTIALTFFCQCSGMLGTYNTYDRGTGCFENTRIGLSLHAKTHPTKLCFTRHLYISSVRRIFYPYQGYSIESSNQTITVIQNYGPTLHKNLGFSPVRQLLYLATWFTLTLGINVMAILLVDLFPRNK